MQPEKARLARSGFLAGLLLLALCLRLYGISEHGPYWDEIVQLVASAGSDLLRPVTSLDSSFTQEDVWHENTVHNVVRAAGSDPPLFFLLLHWWMQPFGTSDLTVRLPSAIAGVVLVYLMFRLSSLLFSEQVAWIAASVATVHPLFVRFSQEARGRMLAMVLAVAATLLFARLLRPAAKESTSSGALTAGYAVCATLALLTHNMCFGVFVGHVAYTLLRVRERQRLLSVLAAWLTACLCIAIWLASAMDLDYLARMQPRTLQRAVSGDSGGGFLYPSTPRFVAAGLVKVLLSMSALDVHPTLLGFGFRVRDFAWLVALPLIVIWAGRRQRANLNGGRTLLLLIVGSVVMELLGLAWLSGHTMSLRPHYAAFGAPFLVPLLAFGMVGLYCKGNWTKRMLALLLVVQGTALVIGLGEVYTDEILWHRPPNGYAALASQIVAVVRPGDVVVFPTWADARITNLYLRHAPPIRQRVAATPWADASILGNYGLPNTPEGSVAVVPPTREPILVVTAEGRERARLAHPIYW